MSALNHFYGQKGSSSNASFLRAPSCHVSLMVLRGCPLGTTRRDLKTRKTPYKLHHQTAPRKTRLCRMSHVAGEHRELPCCHSAGKPSNSTSAGCTPPAPSGISPRLFYFNSQAACCHHPSVKPHRVDTNAALSFKKTVGRTAAC